jgi:hypothetical protein
LFLDAKNRFNKAILGFWLFPPRLADDCWAGRNRANPRVAREKCRKFWKFCTPLGKGVALSNAPCAKSRKKQKLIAIAT